MAIDHFQSPAFSLRQLQYAVAVVETGGFGAAATLCGVSQPSLSAQVAKLESVLETQLFVRGGKGVRLSPAGERLIPTFREALAASAAVEIAVTSLRDPYAIPIRIAVIPTVAPYLLPAVTRSLADVEGPQVHWLELQTHEAEAALAKGRADAILIADPPQEAGLDDHVLGWEPFVVAMPSGTEVPEAVPVNWLHAQQVLLLEQGHCLRDQTLSLCALPRGQHSPFRATSLGTMVQMVAAGFGVSVLPSMAVGVEAARADMTIRPFAEDGIGRTLRLVAPRGHPRAALLDDLVVKLRHAMAG